MQRILVRGEQAGELKRFDRREKLKIINQAGAPIGREKRKFFPRRHATNETVDSLFVGRNLPWPLPVVVFVMDTTTTPGSVKAKALATRIIPAAKRMLFRFRQADGIAQTATNRAIQNGKRGARSRRSPSISHERTDSVNRWRRIRLQRMRSCIEFRLAVGGNRSSQSQRIGLRYFQKKPDCDQIAVGQKSRIVLPASPNRQFSQGMG